jgi:hypothetical protein
VFSGKAKDFTINISEECDNLNSKLEYSQLTIIPVTENLKTYSDVRISYLAQFLNIFKNIKTLELLLI